MTGDDTARTSARARARASARARDAERPTGWRLALAVAGACLGTALLFALSLFGGTALGEPARWLGGEDAAMWAGCLGVSGLSILLAWLWRRRGGRDPWQGLGLRLGRRTATHLAAGLALAAVVAGATTAVVTATGTASWQSSPAPGEWLTYLPYTLALALLLQGFPEELWFRGHLQDRLSSLVPVAGVVALSTLWFGALHVVSGGPETAWQQIGLMAQATAFGFACAAARQRTGLIWIAVGIHTGFHLWRGLLVPVEATFTAVGTLSTVAGYLVVGGLLLRFRRS